MITGGMRPLKCGCLGELMLFSDLAGISSFREGKRITVHRDPVYGAGDFILLLRQHQASYEHVLSLFMKEDTHSDHAHIYIP